MKEIIVDKGVRFQNYAIDLLIIFVLYYITFGRIKSIPEAFDILIFEVIYFLYYFLLELKYNQTFGKKYTKTLVVNLNGGKPSVKELFIRSILRIPGVDSFSFCVGTNVGIHDVLSNTRVIKKA